MSKEEVGKSLKIILDMLKDTNEDNRISKAAIGRKLDENDMKCHRNTVESRLDTLRDMGYDIVEIPRKGVYLEQEENDLTDGQLRILIDSIISTNLLNKKNLKITVESLAKLGSKDFEKHMKKYAYLTSKIAKNADQSIAMNVEDIQTAILDKKKISCNYTVYDQMFKPQKKYADAIILDPYELAFSDGKYYLVCAFDSSEDITVLRVDRLSDVKILESKCCENQVIKKLKKNSELYKYIYNQPQLKGGKTEQFKVLCYRDSLDEVFDAFDGNMRKLNLDNTNYDDPDTVGVIVETTREAMKAWAIIHAGNAVVIHPEDLKEEIYSDLKNAEYTYYKTGQPAWVRSRNTKSLDDAIRELKISKRNALIYTGQTYHSSYEKIDLSKYDFSSVNRIRLLKCDITNSKFQQELPEIESVNFTKTIFDPEILYQLPNLKNLELWDLKINDISFITDHPSIESMYIAYCDNITDFSPLLELPDLKKLSIHNKAFDDNIISLIKKKFPEIDIYYAGNKIGKRG